MGTINRCKCYNPVVIWYSLTLPYILQRVSQESTSKTIARMAETAAKEVLVH